MVVCIEERTWDVNCGDVALLVGIDGDSVHIAVGGNCR